MINNPQKLTCTAPLQAGKLQEATPYLQYKNMNRDGKGDKNQPNLTLQSDTLT